MLGRRDIGGNNKKKKEEDFLIRMINKAPIVEIPKIRRVYRVSCMSEFFNKKNRKCMMVKILIINN